MATDPMKRLDNKDAKRVSNSKAASNSKRRNMWLLILTTLLVIGSIFMFTPPQDKITQGLDVQGGLSVVLSAQSTNGEPVTAEDMEKSRSIIESRVNALGASEATVQVQGNDQILVQIPGMQDTEAALATIGRTGKLEFVPIDAFTNEEDRTAIENGTYIQQQSFTDDLGNSLPGSEMTYRTVEPGTYTPVITGESIQRVTIGRASETGTDYAVNITLDPAGAQAFGEATRQLAPTHQPIVIVLDNQIQSAPRVQTAITDGNVQITGNYTLEEAQSLQTVLESGSLPVSFHYEQSQVVGPTLGQDALAGGVLVALIGLLLVIIYLIVFYKGLGLLTAAAMAVFGVLYLGLLATLSAFHLFSLSLAGVAGIVLTIGMAADSSILVLERFREEIRMGRSVRASSISGVKHAILTSIDADLVTLVSALALFFLASASVKGFGLTLSLGIVCDIVMMLLLKAPLIRLLAPKVIANHPGFWGIKDSLVAAPVYEALVASEGQVAQADVKRKRSKGEGQEQGLKAPEVLRERFASLKGRFIKRDIGFMAVRKVLLTVSACLVVASLAVVGFKGVEFGIEFVGGTSTNIQNTGDVSIDQVRQALNEAGQPDAVIQTTSTNGVNGFLIRTAETSPEGASAVANDVAEQLGFSGQQIEVNTVGPDWGAGVIQASLIAFVVSILLIIAYIAIRFEYKMGLMAIVALLHDLVIVVGVYALFGREITPNTIAALLTILGYSLYDTVVVFHRIADNMKDSDVKCTFMSMANHSLNQVFVRTVNTTLTSFVPVLAMLLFGGETLKDFAFAMAIGLIAGSYSSIAVATPLFAMWKSKEPQFAKLAKRFGEGVERFTFASTPVALLDGVAAPGVSLDAVAEATVEQVQEGKERKDAASAQTKEADATNAGSSTGPSAGEANQPKKIKYRRKKK